MSDEKLFTEMVPGVRIAHVDVDKLILIFGDTVSPTHVEPISRPNAVALGVALATKALGRPMYSRAMIAIALTGAARIAPTPRLRVLVADNDGDVYEADVYGVTETAVTLLLAIDEQTGKETLKDVQPLQILHMEVQR